MEEKEFLKLYIPALESALANDDKNFGYHVHGPDWYIEDEGERDKVDLFEEENFEKYRSLFQKVAYYFDAKSHYFDCVGTIPIEDYKLQLIRLINQLKSQHQIE